MANAPKADRRRLQECAAPAKMTHTRTYFLSMEARRDRSHARRIAPPVTNAFAQYKARSTPAAASRHEDIYCQSRLAARTTINLRRIPDSNEPRTPCAVSNRPRRIQPYQPMAVCRCFAKRREKSKLYGVPRSRARVTVRGATTPLPAIARWSAGDE